MVGRLPGVHYFLLNGHSVGAIESASRFDCAAEIAVQTGMAFDITSVSCRILSLGHILIGYVFDAVIAIAHSDPDDGNEDDRNGVYRVSKPGEAIGSWYNCSPSPVFIYSQKEISPAIEIRDLYVYVTQMRVSCQCVIEFQTMCNFR